MHSSKGFPVWIGLYLSGVQDSRRAFGSKFVKAIFVQV